MRFTSVQHNASALRIALIGHQMVHFETTESIVLSPQIGRMIEEVRVEARSIEIIWDDGLALTTTMRRKGSWHICRAGDNQVKRKKSAQVVIGLSDLSVICCGASEVETHHDFDPHRHPILGRQGPDLSNADVDLDECVDRMLRYEDADATIAEVLLDQRVMRGVGNVYRCELLWACELHPWAKVSSLSRDECRELVSLAAGAILEKPQHVATELAVYGRHGKTCARCNGLIRVTHHGEANRVLYWCADCQVRHAGTSSSRYVTEHDTPPGVHPAEHIYLSELAQARKSV
jgi:endonuclease-8